MDTYLEKLKGEYVFRQLRDDIFHCVNEKEFTGTPADLADLCGVAVPDYTQFLRVIDREQNLHFEFRAYDGCIRINIRPVKS